MGDINDALAANRAAVDELIAAAERCNAVWSTPCAPGKWAPSQIVEHVARSLEESANVVAGAPSKLPTLPFFLRPLVRTFLFNRFDRECRTCASAQRAVASTAFGSVTVSDYATFIELHTRHHCRQMPAD